jgi:hypothetical protein
MQFANLSESDTMEVDVRGFHKEIFNRRDPFAKVLIEDREKSYSVRREDGKVAFWDVKESELSKRAKVLILALGGDNAKDGASCKLYSKIYFKTLFHIVGWYDREVAICRARYATYLVLGHAVTNRLDAGGGVNPLPHTIMILHIHPSVVAEVSHFEGDKKANGKQVPSYAEAVIDLRNNVVVIKEGKVVNSVNDSNNKEFITLPRDNGEFPSFIGGENGDMWIDPEKVSEEIKRAAWLVK